MTQPRLAGILVQDVVYLIASLDDAFFFKAPSIVGERGRFTYEDHGLKFTVAFNDGLVKSYNSVYGRRWTVHLEFSSHVRTQPYAGPNCMDRRGCWQTLTDWKIEGDELDFCAEITTAKMFGLIV